MFHFLFFQPRGCDYQYAMCRILGDLGENRHDGRSILTVERCGGLVCQDRLRLSDQSARNRDALLFAATEFARICIDFVRQSDARERIFGAFDGAAGMLAAHVERKAHVV
jgi:hypothetical protein